MSTTTATQLTLITNDPITIHCFFSCKHVAQSMDPQEAHDLMERHYTEKHSQQIDRICGRTKRSKQ